MMNTFPRPFNPRATDSPSPPGGNNVQSLPASGDHVCIDGNSATESSSAAQSRTYLFNNIMNCGLCGGKFAVIIGGEPSKVR